MSRVYTLLDYAVSVLVAIVVGLIIGAAFSALMGWFYG